MSHNDVVLAVMARAPSARGKTRLVDALGISDGQDLRRALLLDTLDVAAHAGEAIRAILYTPPESAAEFHQLVPPATHFIQQRHGDLGARLHGAFEDLHRLGAGGALILGSDAPTLPASFLARAIALVRARPHSLIIGPATDGGYYLIGLTTPDRRLFDDIPWGTHRVLRLTIDRAAAIGLDVVMLPEWFDVDSPRDLARALCDDPKVTLAHEALNTRAWAAGAPAAVRSRLGL